VGDSTDFPAKHQLNLISLNPTFTGNFLMLDSFFPMYSLAFKTKLVSRGSNQQDKHLFWT